MAKYSTIIEHRSSQEQLRLGLKATAVGYAASCAIAFPISHTAYGTYTGTVMPGIALATPTLQAVNSDLAAVVEST